ncbi:MAG: hypothetical protein K2Q13_03920 [Nitrosomonas sp.]|uniref:hypothetical protein n=1 Tax=Nitrosomonas sp. TaxID=42353 RepID=UPI002600A206|nr:hypothetical protein [Nitrosomonas sp.]MBY0474194.1 hypothetical protein [Nitrosomonas sp.]
MKLLPIFVILIASSFLVNAANATTVVPHQLIGSVTHVNASMYNQAWHVPFTSHYNARFNNLSACNAAKDLALNGMLNILPASFSGTFGNFQVIGNVECVPVK